MTYKRASALAQAKAVRPTGRRAGNFAPEALSLEDERQILIRKQELLHEDRKAETDKGRRLSLGQQISQNAGLISALNRRIRERDAHKLRTLKDYIIDAARKRLAEEWKSVMDEAHEQFRKLGVKT